MADTERVQGSEIAPRVAENIFTSFVGTLWAYSTAGVNGSKGYLNKPRHSILMVSFFPAFVLISSWLFLTTQKDPGFQSTEGIEVRALQPQRLSPTYLGLSAAAPISTQDPFPGS